MINHYVKLFLAAWTYQPEDAIYFLCHYEY